MKLQRSPWSNNGKLSWMQLPALLCFGKRKAGQPFLLFNFNFSFFPSLFCFFLPILTLSLSCWVFFFMLPLCTSAIWLTGYRAELFSPPKEFSGVGLEHVREVYYGPCLGCHAGIEVGASRAKSPGCCRLGFRARLRAGSCNSSDPPRISTEGDLWMVHVISVQEVNRGF